MDEQGLAPGAPLVGRRASRPGTRTRCSASSAATSLRCCAGRRARRCRRPRTTWRASSACCRRCDDAAGWHGRRPVPVPVPIACCTDVDVIGAPFYLMHLVDGVVVRESLPAGARGRSRGGARRARIALVDALAGIHRFDWRAGGLDGFGRPDGYLERQVPRWLGQLERYKTRELPEVDEAGEWLHGARAADAAAGRDPRRLQARQRDARAATCRSSSSRSSTGSSRRSAIRSSISVGCSGCGPSRATRASLAGVTPFAGPRRRADAARAARAVRRRTPTATSSTSNYYCVLGLFKLACVMEGSFARFRAGHERRRVLRVARTRRARARAPRPRVRERRTCSRRHAHRRD